jgi:hypothetical protein
MGNGKKSKRLRDRAMRTPGNCPPTRAVMASEMGAKGWCDRCGASVAHDPFCAHLLDDPQTDEQPKANA